MRLALAALLLAGAPAWGQGADKAPAGSGTWLPRQTAELKVLDKVRAQSVPLSRQDRRPAAPRDP